MIRNAAPETGSKTGFVMFDQTLAGEALLALFQRAGYGVIEPPVLQPAELFLDLSGEEMRRRMFVTLDANGAELCLRPEYTIPVCRTHLARQDAGAAGEAGHSRTGAARYCYRGPVFRLRAGETGEFQQAGVESIGATDIAATDAEILALALEGLNSLQIMPARVTLGDVGLLEAVIDALAIPAAARGRLMRAIVAGEGRTVLDAPEDSVREVAHAGLLAALEGQDPKAARAFVEDVLAIAGITSVGGRSAGDIAERFLARAAQGAGGIPDEARAVLRRYLAVAGDPDAAASALRALADEAGLSIGPALDLFEERAGFLAASGVDLAMLHFRADFARTLDYYTGFIFDIAASSDPAARPLVGGGRYDRLARHLDPQADLPAIGCSFWLDRIAACLAAAPGNATGDAS